MVTLGGIQSGAYAAWDFAGQPGHDQIAGLIALDTITHLDPLRLDQRRTLGTALRFGARGLERTGLAWKVRVPAAHVLAAKRLGRDPVPAASTAASD